MLIVKVTVLMEAVSREFMDIRKQLKLCCSQTWLCRSSGRCRLMPKGNVICASEEKDGPSSLLGLPEEPSPFWCFERSLAQSMGLDRPSWGCGNGRDGQLLPGLTFKVLAQNS